MKKPPQPSEMQISFTVPLIPPSANNYVRHTLTGHHYKTRPAKDFCRAVWICGQGHSISGKTYEVMAVFYLGARQRGDVDNFAKVMLDSLQGAGIIDSDAKVTDLILRKRRDRQNPRTEITVKVLE